MKHRPWRKSTYQATSLIAVVLLALVIFVSATYFFFLSPDDSAHREAQLARLQSQRALWEERRPVAYQFVVERHCECPPEYTRPFVVTDEAWIDDVFTMVEKAIVAGEVITVAYDPRFAYPNDVLRAAERMYIRDFEVLQYTD